VDLVRGTCSYAERLFAAAEAMGEDLRKRLVQRAGFTFEVES
jgi:hypothetical protein